MNSNNTEWFIVGIFVIILGAIGLTSCNHSSGNRRLKNIIKVDINPPRPRVVSVDAEDKIKRLDYKININGTVLNEGGRGKVLVTCYLYFGKKTYKRTSDIYMNSNQLKKMHFTFNEVSIWKGVSEYRYEMKVKAIH